MTAPTTSARLPAGGPTPPSEPPTGRRRVHRAVVLVLAVGLLAGLRVLGASPVSISSSSMVPTLHPGDVVLVSRSAPQLPELERGDLVTFTSPEDGRRALKRVVGLPGDSVVIKDAVLHVNGSPVDEPYVDSELLDAYYSRTYEVPPGAVFVLGDHRGGSTDSRDYGPVAADALQGEVLVRLWPLVGTRSPAR